MGKNYVVNLFLRKNIVHRMAVGVRHAGDDGSASFRIPGLVTTNKGTLLGVYDVRYNSSVDLQEYVDVGLSRSIDGGRIGRRCVFRFHLVSMVVCLKHRMG